MSRQWTKGQKDAIKARGGTLLVSAAAGSGKTAVLVQRVLELLTDPDHPSDADRLLVVTFTRAAASEMSSRIEAEIARILEKDPGNPRMRRQQLLLPRAHISTIDSFCSDLVRENFYRLGVAPDFRILDGSEDSVLRSEAADEALREFYEKGDAAFYAFVEAFSSGRDDSGVAKTVNRLYDFVRSHPFPLSWMRDKASLYDTRLPAEKTDWGKTVLSFAEDAVEYCISVTGDSLARMAEDGKISAAYRDGYLSDLAGLKGLAAALRGGTWDGAASAFHNFTFQKLGSLRGYAGSALKNRLSDSRSEVKATVRKTAALFSPTGKQCREDIARTGPVIRKLFEVTKRFAEILSKMKKERRAVDFSDLEHLALRLLVRETDSGYERTQVAKELADSLDEIMVDEYQDTNETQDLIFRAVSREEKNLFLVGDVKQSIYRFRQAMPQIFLKRRRAWPIYDRKKNRYPACVVLDRNFRSRAGVTDAVNFVFRQLMSRKTGDLDYTKSEELVPAAEYPPDGGEAAELDVLDLSGSAGEQDAIEAECRLIAEKIRAFMDGRPRVLENGKQRPAGYRDFCILLRSANRPAHDYVRNLTAMGLPAWADTSGGFFEESEIGTALSLLRVIDNPMQDVPLLSVMMSPIYGFTADEMAGIRIKTRSGHLYPAVAAAAKEGGKAADFLFQIDEFRTLAATMPSDQLIRAVFEKTGYPDLVEAMPNGDLRLSNLRLLLEYAGKYEASGYHGLTGFLRFLDRMQQSRGDLAAASAVGGTADVVRVMSIHRAKGLEFPCCFLAGCSHRFNREKPAVLLHPELGLGIRLRGKNGVFYDTMPREAVALEIERDEMSEELRILYVAMTRAKEKLFLVTSLKDAKKTLAGLAPRLTDGPRLEPYTVRSASSISDWLLLCALRHPDGRALREAAGVPESAVLPAGERWKIDLIRPSSPAPPAAGKVAAAAAPDRKLMDRLSSALDYSYPYDGLKGVRAKVSASELAEKPFLSRYAASSRPAFLSERSLTASERGTALHAFLQFADYRRALGDMRGELHRLSAENFMTEAQAQAVDVSRARAFLSSPLAKRIVNSPHAEREFRFTVEIPAGRVSPGLPPGLRKEPVVLQGEADCVFEEGDGLVLVDYKTDRIADPAALWARYREQLDLYRFALEQCTGKKVRECLLYSFYLDAEVRRPSPGPRGSPENEPSSSTTTP